MQLSSQILKYRKAAHLTQEQLALELGVTPQAVSNWERGGAPDIGMLPMIANYFRITIDELMGNDTENIQNEKNEFWNALHFISGEERIAKLAEYRKKFPHDVFAMRHIIDTICELPKDKQAKYIPQAEMLCEKILDECNDPDLRNSAVYNMCMLCSREERDKWLTFLPQYNTYQRQNVNKLLLCEDGDYSEAALQSAVIRYSRMADFCDTGIPDFCGAEEKIRWERQILRILDGISEDGILPEAWLGIYAYKCLVLSAAYFGSGNTDDGWLWFDAALEKLRRWFDLPDTALPASGIYGLCLTKDMRFIVLPDGRRQKNLSRHANFSISAEQLYFCLTSPRWAWFDNIREDERFMSAVEWTKTMIPGKDNKK